jgi:glycine dehydrogenase
MLEVVGVDSLEALSDLAVPRAIRAHEALAIAAAASESDVVQELRALAARNTVATSMIGLGYYGTITPPVIARNVLENPAWYTAYTHQPEISQGRLEALLNFRPVSDLTGLTTSGASLLDEATAAAEAMTLMRRSTKVAADAVFVVDEAVFPQTLAVINTRAVPLGIQVVVTDLSVVDSAETLRACAGGSDVFGVLVQYPDLGGARDHRAWPR